jgi:branched-subunit amino acid ABC-type transport system permease component/ABC-type branched-subunit amino acid transport system ATPase component
VTKFLTLVIPGAVSGAIYAIMASGLVLTYQTSGIFNFAHGAVAFIVALLFFELHQPASAGGLGWPIVPAAIVSILVFAPLLGLLLERVLLRRLATAPVYARIVGTIGLLVALPNLGLWIIDQGNAIFDWGLPTTTQVFQPPGLGPVPKETWQVMEGVVIDSNQVAVLAAAAFVAVGLWFLLRHTRIGLRMRASVDRRDLAELRGVDTGRVSAFAWMLSMAMAGLGGVLLAPLFDLGSLSFTLVVLGSVAAVVVAGFRSIPIAFAAGLGFGVVQNLIFGYAPDFLRDISGFNSSIVYLLAFVILVLLGTVKGRAAGQASEGLPPPDHRAGLPAWRRRLPWLVAAVLLALYVQFVASDFWASQFATGLSLSLIFLSFVVVTGLGGMISLAQATFVTAGAFMGGWLINYQFAQTTPILMNNGRLNFLICALAGALVAAIVGVIVAIPVRRLGALELALATLAIAFVGDTLVFQLDEVGNGSSGYLVPAPQFGPFDFNESRSMVMLLILLVGLGSLLIHNLQRSATGRAMLAVRSSEVAARTSGISPARAKLTIFAVSAAIAGFGGVMYASINSPFTNTTAPAFFGLIWLAVTVIWGIRRPGGAIIAGLFYALFARFLVTASEYTSAPWSWIPEDVRGALASPYFVPILFGIAAINLAQNPDGILALVGHQRRERKRERERRAAERAAPPPVPEIAVVSGDGGGRAAAALDLEGIVAGYGDVEVLHGVDLVLASGRCVTLLGANGAGKSTLAVVAAGLLPPVRGRVVRDGRDVTAQSADQRARDGLLLVPEARGIFPGLTVEDNLALRLRSPAERTRAYERFPLLAQRRGQPAGLLSGGEQQMLSLAAALVQPPEVLIADEPSLGLAPLAAEAVFEALTELRGMGVALLLVEEKAREAMAVADTVAIMELGTVAWTGRREDADADRLAAAYLGEASLTT